MRYRKLRIAWSVGCCIACVLLITLWVRSYWWHDYCRGPVAGTHGLYFDSAQGRIGASAFAPGMAEWIGASQPFDQSLEAMARRFRQDWVLGFGITRVGNVNTYLVPHWFVAGSFAILGAVPWIRRFRLCTLLIATTLVAVVLGLAVYAAGK
jgi:hypothetical protein